MSSLFKNSRKDEGAYWRGMTNREWALNRRNITFKIDKKLIQINQFRNSCETMNYQHIFRFSRVVLIMSMIMLFLKVDLFCLKEVNLLSTSWKRTLI